jgi:hypothetical protein
MGVRLAARARSGRAAAKRGAVAVTAMAMLALGVPAVAAASWERVNFRVAGFGTAEGPPVQEVEAQGGPLGSAFVPIEVEENFSPRSSLVHITSNHSPTLMFTGTELYTLPGGTVSDRVNGAFHYYGLPVGLGSTFTAKGSINITGGTGRYAGAWGEGSFQEAGILASVEPYEEPFSGTATWDLHLP